MADKITSFSSVFDTFLSKITDDMYMELSEEETLPLQEELLMSALPHFEFPRKDIFNFDKENQVFNVDLSLFVNMINFAPNIKYKCTFWNDYS